MALNILERLKTDVAKLFATEGIWGVGTGMHNNERVLYVYGDSVHGEIPDQIEDVKVIYKIREKPVPLHAAGVDGC